MRERVVLIDENADVLSTTTIASEPVLDVNLVGSSATVTVTGTVTATPTPSATVGLTQHKTDALVATATAVKASAGAIYGYHIANLSNADAYLQIYNIAAASVTVGSSTRTRTIFIPQGGLIDSAFAYGLTFSTAISIAATTTITGNTAPSTGLLVMVDYA